MAPRNDYTVDEGVAVLARDLASLTTSHDNLRKVVFGNGTVEDREKSVLGILVDMRRDQAQLQKTIEGLPQVLEQQIKTALLVEADKKVQAVKAELEHRIERNTMRSFIKCGAFEANGRGFMGIAGVLLLILLIVIAYQFGPDIAKHMFT